MLLDNDTIFSDDQVVTVTADSTNELDHIADGGPYKKLFLFVKTEALFAGGTSLKFALHTSNDGFGSDDDTLFESAVIITADLTANKVLARIPLPLGVKQDMKMVYTVVGTMTGGGGITAALVFDVEDQIEVS